MRDYRKKMQRYRLPPDEYKRLREFCKTSEAEQYIYDALLMEFGEAPDMLQWWIFKHVTRTDYNWAYMEARQIPCCRDTFLFYRTKFYWCLSQVLKAKGATI